MAFIVETVCLAESMLISSKLNKLLFVLQKFKRIESTTNNPFASAQAVITLLARLGVTSGPIYTGDRDT